MIFKSKSIPIEEKHTEKPMKRSTGKDYKVFKKQKNALSSSFSFPIF
jgi:hypothetical protein